jgi:hypothetical protein
MRLAAYELVGETAKASCVWAAELFCVANPSLSRLLLPGGLPGGRGWLCLKFVAGYA